jgi:hypothetical protein
MKHKSANATISLSDEEQVKELMSSAVLGLRDNVARPGLPAWAAILSRGAVPV